MPISCFHLSGWNRFGKLNWGKSTRFKKELRSVEDNNVICVREQDGTRLTGKSYTSCSRSCSGAHSYFTCFPNCATAARHKADRATTVSVSYSTRQLMKKKKNRGAQIAPFYPDVSNVHKASQTPPLPRSPSGQHPLPGCCRLGLPGSPGRCP